MNKLIYVSDISFPNTSAQAIQILKMCDEFSNKYKVHLLINNKYMSLSLMLFGGFFLLSGFFG